MNLIKMSQLFHNNSYSYTLFTPALSFQCPNQRHSRSHSQSATYSTCRIYYTGNSTHTEQTFNHNSTSTRVNLKILDLNGRKKYELKRLNLNKTIHSSPYSMLCCAVVCGWCQTDIDMISKGFNFSHLNCFIQPFTTLCHLNLFSRLISFELTYRVYFPFL